MLRQIKKMLAAPLPELKRADVIDLTLAVCVVLLEIANADDEFTPEEEERIRTALQERYDLSEGESEDLIEAALQARAKSLDLWSFTNRVNEAHSEAERMQIMEEVWRIIYADGSLDQHEDYLVHKLAGLLQLRHKQMIDAKVKVLREIRGE